MGGLSDLEKHKIEQLGYRGRKGDTLSADQIEWLQAKYRESPDEYETAQKSGSRRADNEVKSFGDWGDSG